MSHDPYDYVAEVCAVCGCGLSMGITPTGRCVEPSHRSTGGVVVRVQLRPLDEQDERVRRRARGWPKAAFE